MISPESNENVIYLKSQDNILNPEYKIDIEINNIVYPNMLSYAYSNLFKKNSLNHKIVINSFDKGDDLYQIALSLFLREEKEVITESLYDIFYKNIFRLDDRELLNTYPEKITYNLLGVNYGDFLTKYRDQHIKALKASRNYSYNTNLEETNRMEYLNKNMIRFITRNNINLSIQQLKDKLGPKDYEELLYRVSNISKIQRLSQGRLDQEYILERAASKNDIAPPTVQNDSEYIITQESSLNPYKVDKKFKDFYSIADYIYYNLCNKLLKMTFNEYRKLFGTHNLKEIYSNLRNEYIEENVLDSLNTYISKVFSMEMIARKIYVIDRNKGDIFKAEKRDIAELEREINSEYRFLLKEYLNKQSDGKKLEEHIRKHESENIDTHVATELIYPKAILENTIGKKLIYKKEKDNIMGVTSKPVNYNYAGKCLENYRFKLCIVDYDKLLNIIKSGTVGPIPEGITDTLLIQEKKEVLLFLTRFFPADRKAIIKKIYLYYLSK